MRKLIVIAATLLATALVCACASVSRIDAAGDVHALLIAIRDDDQAGFDAHVDKVSLKRNLEMHLISRARAAPVPEGMRALGALLAGPAADLAGEALLRPRTFRAAAAYYGYTPDKPIPNRAAIASALRAVDYSQVCVTRGKTDPCLMTFSRQGDTWRLISFADPSLLGLK